MYKRVGKAANVAEVKGLREKEAENMHRRDECYRGVEVRKGLGKDQKYRYKVEKSEKGAL